jgi:hypothetical protein
MEKALALILEFGERFSTCTTSKQEADVLIEGFKGLGYRVRVTPLGSDAGAIRRGFREYKVTWWPAP